MRFVRDYLVPRLVQYVLVVFCGITAVFFIPRLTGQDPVLEIIAQIQAQGASLDPLAVRNLMETLKELYGLKGSLFEQYLTMWRRVFTFDFGPSFFQFPTPVAQLLRIYLPWTIGLFATSTVLSWALGNIIGGIAGYFSGKSWSKILDAVIMVIRPIPHYIFGVVLLILFAYVWPLFPARGLSIGRGMALNLELVLAILRGSFLPALTLVILGGVVWFQQMKLLVQNVKREDFVEYARVGGVKERRVVFRYVLKNAMLPQVTQLALALGQVFSGVLIVEMVFSYPGMGLLLYRGVTRGDYNLVMGITVLSILTIATAVLLLDLLYPLLDPRIRHR
ncbi:ABC transporter permease subunit [Candidatus Caldatribacterium saccharofermentans]|uniref:ABC transporter permease n=2 Tax=Candidatus Caldatribacterium saccharofermentans TaxID=1454753 RepID=A0A7V4WLK9_9BACT